MEVVEIRFDFGNDNTDFLIALMNGIQIWQTFRGGIGISMNIVDTTCLQFLILGLSSMFS